MLTSTDPFAIYTALREAAATVAGAREAAARRRADWRVLDDSGLVLINHNSETKGLLERASYQKVSFGGLECWKRYFVE